MTFIDQLAQAQRLNDSLLCVGLDPEPSKFPGPGRASPDRIYDFCAAIVDATKDLVCAFKPQIAYFAAHRAEDQLERLMAHMRRAAPNVPVILDAKRGDIGSTADQYAHEAFTRYQADAVTLSPFMGFDTMEPFLKYPGKGVILLCRTSNPGGSDLQNLRLADVEGQPRVYEHIAKQAQGPWNTNGQMGLVWARPSLKRSPACASWRRRCPADPRGGARRVAMPWPPSRPASRPTRVAPSPAPSWSTARAPCCTRAAVTTSPGAARRVAQQTRDALNAAR